MFKISFAALAIVVALVAGQVVTTAFADVSNVLNKLDHKER